METAKEVEKATLFERLGGTAGISAIVDEVVQTHMENPAISARFIPYNDEPERLAVIKKHTVDFFSAGSGGAVEYKGRSMEETHTGMNISREEYTHVIDDIMLVLGNHGMSDDTKKEVLFILWSLRDMIISR